MADAKLIIKPPHMLVRMKPGFWPDFPKMQQTIKDAGYQPGEDPITLRVTGKVVRQAEGLALELDSMKTATTLLVVPAKEEAETAAHLEQHLGQTVEVEGRWQPATPEKTTPALAVTAILSTGHGPTTK